MTTFVIDDDSHDMRAIDEHIRQHSRVDLNDNNVVDYLLGITEDTIKPEAKAIERPRQPQVWVC